MSTSQKMKDFTSEPMGEKNVKMLAGIGEVLGNKLIEEVNVLTMIIILTHEISSEFSEILMTVQSCYTIQ